RRNLRRFKDRGVFQDMAPAGQNACFGELQLRDPDGHFTLVAVVPAVLLINHNLLGDDPAPRTWEDLLHPRFTRRVALPVGDFDLFNGILLNLHRLYGHHGVRALARNMLVSLHPAQTVGRFSARAESQPAISVVPYFFSKMTMNSKALTTVWPEDGAIISPIFMLVRRSALPAAAEVARLFLCREVGEVLAHRGLFPVLSPEVDNRLPAGAGFRWLGWDYVREHDLGQLIPELDRTFHEATS
ncbi:MAG: ABC transporter substrate-binding protein, partial [Deltaproteobacteria bacterium]|nr:ABC transporter substrate-binding protein [Deltaproteobacteria bacterium]